MTFLPSHDGWARISSVKSMRVSFCIHPNITFTSNVFINIHPGASMLKNVFVTLEVDTEEIEVEDQFIL